MHKRFSRFLLLFTAALIVGPLGPVLAAYDRETAQAIALRAVPGKVIATDSYKLSDRNCDDVEVPNPDYDADDPDLDEDIPETITEEECRRSNSRLYFEYSILVPDGSVYEVEVSARTGEVYEIEVEQLSANPQVPFPILGTSIVTAAALAEIDDREMGLKKAKLLSVSLGEYKRRLVYLVKGQKYLKKVEITMDAKSGEILDYDRL